MALEAASLLLKRITVQVVNARFIKPMDTTMLAGLLDAQIPLLTLEEAALPGGFGSAVLEFACTITVRHRRKLNGWEFQMSLSSMEM